MPILDVKIIGPLPEPLREGVAQRLADAAGRVFASPPQGTWVTVHVVEAEAYAESGGGPPEGTRPVIASVLKAERPEGADLASQVALLTRAIAEACGRREEDVHLVFEPSGRGRVAFGGLIRS